MALSVPNKLFHFHFLGYWHYGFNACAAYSYADVFLCSASIVHMSIISLDRYLGISRPLKTRNKSKLVVTLKITCVWVITTMISCPIAILAIVNPRDIFHDRVCAIDNPYFLIYGSTLAFLIPCLIMVATYVRTTQLLRQQALLCSSANGSGRSHDGGPAMGLRRTRTRHRRSSSKRSNGAAAAAHNRKRHSSSDSRSLTSRRNSPSYVSSSEMCLRPPSLKRYPIATRSGPAHQMNDESSQIEIQRNDRLQVTLPSMACAKNRRQSHCSDDSLDCASMIEDSQIMQTANNPEKTLRNKFRERTITFWNKTTRRSSSATELANEQKATRVLGLVFGCFITCWTPFFVQNFIVAFCGQSCHMPHWLTSMFLWLGYLSSTINPIIYTTFNKRFRQAFGNILRCRCCRRDSQKRLSRASASSFYNSVNNNYHGYLTSAGGGCVVSPANHNINTTYGKCTISRTPPDLIAANASVNDPILRT